MKKILLPALSTIFLTLILSASFAQQNNETEIRKLEKALDSAILKSDTILIAKLFSPQIVVNSPANTIVKFNGVMGRIRTGQIDYSSFEKVLEHLIRCVIKQMDYCQFFVQKNTLQ